MTIGALLKHSAAPLLLALAPALARAAACDLDYLALPVKMVGMRPVATLGINGVDVPLVVDSGAFFSMLTGAAAEQLKLQTRPAPFGLRIYGVTGPMDGVRFTTVKQLRFGEHELPNVDFLVGGNEPGAHAMGLLGRNLLDFTDMEYDLAHGEIRLVFPKGDCDAKSMAYWAGKAAVAELPMRRAWSPERAGISAVGRLNGKELHILFDTGAISVVSLNAARRSGITEADLRPSRPVHGVGRGEARAWTAPAEKLELGNEAIEHNRLLVADFDMDDVDMLLGVDFFLSHRIYVSRSQRRLYFTYNGGPVFALNAAGGYDDPSAPQRPPLDTADAYARRGAAAAARGDLTGALADFDRACELAPDAAEYLGQRGTVQLALKHRDEARRDFDAALGLDPMRSETRLQRAALRVAERDRSGAIDDLAAVSAQVAAQSPMRLEVARLYLRLNLQREALEQWNLWVPSHPRDVALDTVLNERCWARTLLGIELEAALADCDGALERQPKNPAFLDSRGWLHLRRGEPKQALADYERALQLDAAQPSSLYGRGIAKSKLGDPTAGALDVEAARKLRPAIDAVMGRYGLAAEGM